MKPGLILKSEHDGKRIRYSVYDETGKCLAKGRADIAVALAAAEYQAAQSKHKMRACMCCGRQFRSEGIHNRLCFDCKRHDGAPGVWGRGEAT